MVSAEGRILSVRRGRVLISDDDRKYEDEKLEQGLYFTLYCILFYIVLECMTYVKIKYFLQKINIEREGEQE